MINKKLFLEFLPITWNSYSFHEIASILEIDSTIKVAYRFKLKPEGCGVDMNLLNSQSYTPEEIEKNPQYSYQVFNILQRLLDLYVNKDAPFDKLLIYGWYGDYSYNAFYDFMKSNGCNRIHDYIAPGGVDIRSLVMNDNVNDIASFSDFDIKTISSALLDEVPKKDSMSRLVQVVKLYNLVNNGNIHNNKSTE